MSKIEVNEIDAQSGSTITVGSACKSVAVPGNVVKTNAVQASDAGNIISQSGTTITIGASGDTVSLASGASQSGFGRAGSVDWQTSIKTGDFTAANGEGYFINTTSGAVIMTLPSSPSVGDIVALKDYANTFDTNNLTINRNGQPISGTAANSIVSTEGQAITLVYGDSTKGWQSVAASTESDLPKPSFVVASGGTVTTCGNFKVHTFTGPGTFTVSDAGNAAGSNSVDYLVVAGGGGGENNPSQGHGGGAGGFRLSNSTCMPAPTTSPLANPTGITVTATSFPITVGGAGAVCTQGGTSTFSTISSAGGGGGDGGNGGSGAGDGSGNTPPVSPPQGQNGGPGGHSGGGGAGAAGGAFIPPNNGGLGGDGSFVSPTFAGSNGTTGPVGSTRYFAGGGAGGYPVGRPTGIAGGAGGGGFGGEGAVGAGAGATNTGGGGGGTAQGCQGKAGGSGIVIIRYKFQ